MHLSSIVRLLLLFCQLVFSLTDLGMNLQFNRNEIQRVNKKREKTLDHYCR